MNHIVNMADAPYFGGNLGRQIRRNRNGVPYDNVLVLLMVWADDNEGFYGDIRALGNVFRENYQFNVEEFHIPLENSQNAVMNRIERLAQAAYGLETLLIVGYVGHGGLSGDARLMLSPFGSVLPPPLSQCHIF